MLKYLLGFLLFLSIIFITDYAEAHSGRTDSNGGHNCSEKSIAKGLCTGYHYHNGGGSSGGSTPAPAPAPVRTDKNCSDFSSFDEVVEYWNAKGYSASYDPEDLDRDGDGIPCEPPSSYDRTKVNNSPEQIQYKQDQIDKANGEEKGYEQGFKDGLNESNTNSAAASGSNAYKKGYSAGYTKGYQEGKKEVEAEKKKAYDAGYALGQKQDDIQIPGAFTHSALLIKSFEEGFQEAWNERREAKKAEMYNQGLTDGKKDNYSLPDTKEKDFIQEYEKGYEEGQNELKDEFFYRGYHDAFKMLEYQKPSLSNEKLLAWHKEGFESNDVVFEIKDFAFTLGKEGNQKSMPSKFNEGEIIFNHYYDLGFQEYEDYVRKSTNAAAGGVVAIGLAWLGRRVYVAKKMIS
ncbi:excalibur calcium-binding domain-containing protein [Sutcliffiella rhizosphaerae]|uniref:Excalibur calcium-binding domain-containing protein n=1 Tax=Sutcliffiella rhizosphaerae TaxID=2880967 RepID=A0ABN8A8S4_9BACI|nr:excalibur calcium-binding domain-containing protein [Sutcliffiella rhizosphaerae]CAG9620327.1 hypothetical protein BACCIP111883_01095 [Sutcliffiella rhizosphaerae]